MSSDLCVCSAAGQTHADVAKHHECSHGSKVGPVIVLPVCLGRHSLTLPGTQKSTVITGRTGLAFDPFTSPVLELAAATAVAQGWTSGVCDSQHRLISGILGVILADN